MTPGSNAKEEILLIQDNLDGQVQQSYQQMCRRSANALCWYTPPDYTDDLSPVDAGMGAQIKYWFGVYLDEWLWENENIDEWESGRFPASRKRILITHLLKRAWDKVCSKPTSIERYFTKTGCGMTATGEDDNIICPQKFKAGDYSFQYAPDRTLVELQPEGQAGMAEPDAPNDAVAETLGGAMVDAMAREDGDIVDDVEGGGIVDDDAYDINEALEAYKRGDKEYVWVEERENGAASLKAGDTVLFFFEWGWERGVVHSKAKCNKAQKAMAKEYDTPVLVRYVIDGDYILQDFGGEDASYLSREDFDKLRSGEEEASLKVGTKSWCIVKME